LLAAGALTLYFMRRSVEDSGDADEQPAKKRGKGGGIKGLPRGTHAFKVLCPEPLVSSIIGVSGNTRKQIEEETGAQLRISGRDEYFPKVKCRILVITSNGAQQLMAAIDRVISRAVDVGSSEQEALVAGHCIFRIAVPSLSTGRLIGTRGANIQAIRDETGAKINLENDVYEGHQLCKLIGSAVTVSSAIDKILQVIMEELSGDRLLQWAAITNFDTPSVMPKSQDKGDGPKGNSKGSSMPARDRDFDSKREHAPDRHRDRDWDHDGGRERHRSPSPKNMVHRDWGTDSPVDMIRALSTEFPPDSLGMDHAVSCDLPNSRVGSLIGRHGQYINHVQQVTNTIIKFTDMTKNNEDTHQTLTVQGPLINVYAAHMMMMKKYHDDEAQQREREKRDRAPQEPKRDALIEDLQSQLANLQQRLQEAEKESEGGVKSGKNKGGKSKGKGKGKR